MKEERIMRSLDECREIANKMRKGEIKEYPIEAVERDGFLETIAYLTYGLDDDMGFWLVDRLRDEYHFTSEKAIELIYNNEKPKVYTLQTKEK
jgi:hypothetical protein